ncbi:YHYH protein [Botrimarina hoheduenensis]|uniref:YHYH domain-containing protein n=1 Tax=Botrimarina hoheduenensis TaxID=2528000 RepID=A0A5C5WEU6_9BACT|nr:YHYH protein [Botrimarina hoheduenensis]TWT48601.1 hypothetical protein Pla111_03760 [Botrimarina hoheduenensis]
MLKCPPRKIVCAVLALVGIAAVVVAQRPWARRHTATMAQPLELIVADQAPPVDGRVETSQSNEVREVQSNGIPEHRVGRFPNPGNPNTIRAQRHRFNVPLNPRIAPRTTRIGERGRRVFGVAVNGVTFDPGTAEVWQGNHRSGWNYEALGGAIPLGIDENHAHVQPTGKYHYHGLPTKLLEEIGVSAEAHSPLVGWAADGFPIYALYGYAHAADAGSAIQEVASSYRLRSGERPGGDEPTGPYDGAFVQDYEYVPGLGDLDECNGRHGVTPDFPAGTYAYFLTRGWPVVPRVFRGDPALLH